MSPVIVITARYIVNVEPVAAFWWRFPVAWESSKSNIKRDRGTSSLLTKNWWQIAFHALTITNILRFYETNAASKWLKYDKKIVR